MTFADPRWGSRRMVRAVVALAAILCPLLIWTLAVPVLGADLTVPQTPGSDVREPLQMGPILGASTIAVLAGWALLASLERVSPVRALMIWTPIALIVLVLSLPWMPGFTSIERIVISAMHVALGAVLIVGMRRTFAGAAT